jgi:ribosomal protein S18 acetylase RimI-like enzyme
MRISRRQATTEDERFARELHERGYRDIVVRQFGKWDKELQDRFFDEKWFPERYEILRCGDSDCGYLWAACEEDHVDIVEIVILPEYQNQGIGSRILLDEIAKARIRDVPVRLRVLKESRAVPLYERLGFKEVGRSETHIRMECV